METLAATLINNSMIMSLAIVILLCLSKIFHKRYSAKWRYYVWIIVIMGLLIPFRPQLDYAPMQVDEPISIIVSVTQSQSKTLPIEKGEFTPSEKNQTTVPWYSIVSVIWVMGVISRVVYYLWKHRKFKKMVNRWGERASETTIALIEKSKKELHIKDEIMVKSCKFVSTPMLFGFVSPTILLPADHFENEQLELITRHELIHYKRRDLWYKGLALLTITIHWFNPFVYLMAREISKECEISCDEAVLKNSNFDRRIQYGETMINIVKNHSMSSTAFSTQFNGGKKDMKKRLGNIMDTSKKKAGVALVLTALIVTIATGMAFATNNGNQNVIIQNTVNSAGGYNIENEFVPLQATFEDLGYQVNNVNENMISIAKNKKEIFFVNESNHNLQKNKDTFYMNFVKDVPFIKVGVLSRLGYTVQEDGNKITVKSEGKNISLDTDLLQNLLLDDATIVEETDLPESTSYYNHAFVKKIDASELKDYKIENVNEMGYSTIELEEYIAVNYGKTLLEYKKQLVPLDQKYPSPISLEYTLLENGQVLVFITDAEGKSLIESAIEIRKKQIFVEE